MPEKKKTKTCLWSIWAILVTVVIVVGSAVFAYFYWCPQYLGKFPPEELRILPKTTCLTKDCVKATATITSSLDETINPCEDFYQFACGNFIPNISKRPNLSLFQAEMQKHKNRYISSPITGHEPATLLSQKKFFQACIDLEAIDEDGEENLQEMLDSIGGWPLVKGQDWDGTVELENFLVTCKKQGIPFEWFFELIYDSDEGIFYITSPTLEYDNLFFKYEYTALMLDTAMALGASGSLADWDIKRIQQFSKKLQRLAKKNRNDGLHIRMPIEDLHNVFPGISWVNFFGNLTEEIVIPENETVMVLETYMRDLNLLLAGTSTKVQIDYLVWKIIQYFAPYLPKQFRQKFERTLVKLTNSTIPERFDFCIEEAVKRYPKDDVHEFFKWQVDDTRLKNIASIINNVKNSLIKQVESTDWIDDQSKTIALEDLNKYFASLEYLDTDVYEEVLQKYSQIPELEFTSDNATRIIRESNIYKFNKQIWLADAFQDLHMKNISEAVEYLSTSLLYHEYSNQRPEYLNYAALGSDLATKATKVVILNAINSYSHDNENISNENKKENIGNNATIQKDDVSWSNDSLSALLDRGECFINDYDIIFEELVNVESTFAENYAKFIGVNAAYEAYIRWSEENEEELKLVTLPYTPFQLFWIEYGNANCFPLDTENLEEWDSEYLRERFISSLKNSENFANDFNCLLNTPMNPDSKCDMF